MWVSLPGRDQSNVVSALGRHYEQDGEPAKPESLPAILEVAVTPVVAPEPVLVLEDSYCISKVDTVRFQVRPALRFVPFELHLRSLPHLRAVVGELPVSGAGKRCTAPPSSSAFPAWKVQPRRCLTFRKSCRCSWLPLSARLRGRAEGPPRGSRDAKSGPIRRKRGRGGGAKGKSRRAGVCVGTIHPRTLLRAPRG
jgi:hypothetical protein